MLSQLTVCPSECASSTSRWQLHRPAPGLPGKIRHRDAGTGARLRQEGTLFDRRGSRGHREEEEKGKPKEPKEVGDREEAAKSSSGEDQVGGGSFSTPSPRCIALPSPVTGTGLTTRLVWEHSLTRRQPQPHRDQPPPHRRE